MMMMTRQKARKRQRDISTADRISELPDFILHIILSLFDAKEACRASALSKKWYGAWSCIPVLDFQPRYFRNRRYRFSYNDDYERSVQHFVGFVDKTMQRYSEHKYRIKKLNLNLPKTDQKLQSLVDKWIGIAVQNKIEELEILTVDLALPSVLFTAKSLKVLKCKHVELPYYDTMNLISLEHLYLATYKAVDEDMLQRIISFCPLGELDITHQNLKAISLPWTRKVNKGDGCFGNGTIQSDLRTSPLRKFRFFDSGFSRSLPWAWNINVVALKNLNKLEIYIAAITDDIVSEVVSGLVALESLVLAGCSKLKCIRISSTSLKEFRIEDSLESGHLMKATIDAPNLLDFWYNCEVEASLSLIRVHDHCKAYFSPFVRDITILWLVKLKKFLTETNLIDYLVLTMPESMVVVVDEDELRDAIIGSPYKLKELQLRKTRVWFLFKIFPMVFLDGIFLCCHPDVLSISGNFNAVSAEWVLKMLKSKVECKKHPLKSIELEGADGLSLLLESSESEIRFRLTWSSVEP